MTEDKMSWVDETEQKNEEEKEKDYLKIVEGDNRFQILSHAAPHFLKWNGTKYEATNADDPDRSVKGVCWVLQDDVVKSATLPYTVIKQIRALQNDPDYEFSSFPMPRAVNLKAKGAGTKEVEYTVIPSPKETEVPEDILKQLAEKPSPEEMVEKMNKQKEHEEEAIDPSSIPF